MGPAPAPTVRITYSREMLLQIRHGSEPALPVFDMLPEEIRDRGADHIAAVRKRTRRGKKKGGLRARMKRENWKQRALPAIILANVRSLRNKTDELQVNANHFHEYRRASILAFTETWLSKDDDNSAMHIDGFGSPIRLDRDGVVTGKQHGGGVCFYVNPRWCSIIHVREELCTPDIELLAVSCRPFYLPREFPQLFFILVYIHPRAKPTTATDHIRSTLNKLEQLSPDSPKFILGDFNHCDPGRALKGFTQYVTCTTRLEKTLDRCYGSVPDAYKPVTLPPLGSADHHTILLLPAYSPVIRRVKKVTRTIKQWTQEGIMALQGCLESTNWSSLLSPSDDIDDQVDVVSSYINFCEENIIPSKTVTIFPNNKPWVTKELKEIINRKKRIFFSGTELEKREINKEVKRAIKIAKLNYRNKVEEKFTHGNLRSAWQGLKRMAAVNTTSSTAPILIPESSPASLANDLNSFYTRFETDNSTQLANIRSRLQPSSSAITFYTKDVVRALKRTKTSSAPGADNISGRVLKHCADQLGCVFQHLFQSSMTAGIVPKLWKHSTIIPIPKKSTPKTLNDLRPVALTSHVMKAMERVLEGQSGLSAALTVHSASTEGTGRAVNTQTQAVCELNRNQVAITELLRKVDNNMEKLSAGQAEWIHHIRRN
ncbi:uncharacterized protein V6R79_021176 [Siganus canaliculatus]